MKKYSLLFLLILVPLKNFAAVFSLASPAFEANGMIPIAFTCKGADKTPPFFWNNSPPNTRSLALVAQDPDAPSGTWTHWILFNIPPTLNKLDTGVQPEGTALAQNSWGNPKYQGPCPSLGAHRYVFTLYALDSVLTLSNGVATNTALDAMTSHVIGSALLTGLYQPITP
jgi:Raf kinase inhibitor-like YbhB/YbcL family protein